MAKRQKSFASSYNQFSWIVKVILAIIPVTEWIIGTIYRASKGHLIAAIIWFFTGSLFGIGWIIDIVTTILHGKYTFFAR